MVACIMCAMFTFGKKENSTVYNVNGNVGTYLSTNSERVAVYKGYVSWNLEMGDLKSPDTEDYESPRPVPILNVIR